MRSFLILSFISLTLLACQKKKDEPAPTPVPAPVPLTQVSVKVNGVEKHCSSCYSTAGSGGSKTAYFYLDGFNEEIYISLEKVYKPGAYNVAKYDTIASLVYIKNNWNYHAVTGTFNVVKVDTFKSGIKTLVGNFSFKTDTSGDGQHFELAEGAINVQIN